jgi:hypothetical protein
MDDIRAGSRVSWAQLKRDRPDRRVKNTEVFIVQKVSGNGRCDLVDSRGAELFKIPLSDLQPLVVEFTAKNPPYRRNGMP